MSQSPRAPGSNALFSSTSTTTAPEAVWACWTDPASWSQWDGGLVSASCDGPFVLGTRGRLVPKLGRPAVFVVTEVLWPQRCAFVTRLPLATLRVSRSFGAVDAEGRTPFTHTVSFHGPLGFLWALLLGPGFRRELPATMDRLATFAQQAQRSSSSSSA